jgi:hypothetical protein
LLECESKPQPFIDFLLFAQRDLSHSLGKKRTVYGNHLGYIDHRILSQSTLSSRKPNVARCLREPQIRGNYGRNDSSNLALIKSVGLND